MSGILLGFFAGVVVGVLPSMLLLRRFCRFVVAQQPEAAKPEPKLSPTGLAYDVALEDLSEQEQIMFAGTVVEERGNDLIIDWNGRRVLAHDYELCQMRVN